MSQDHRGHRVERRRQSSREDRLDVAEALSFVRRYLPFLVGCSLLCGAAVGAWSVTRAQEFRASAVVRITDERRAIAGGLSEASALDLAAAAKGMDPIQSQIQVLRSRALLGQVVDAEGTRLTTGDFDLDLLSGVTVGPAALVDTLSLVFAEGGFRARSRAGERVAAYGEPVAMGDVRFTLEAHPGREAARLILLPREEAIDRMLSSVRARTREKADVIAIEYVDLAPRRAENVTNTLVSLFRSSGVDAAQDQSRRRRLFLEEQLTHHDSLVVIAEEDLNQFRTSEQVFNSRERFSAQQVGVMNLELRQEEMTAERDLYESLLRNLRERGDGRGLRALLASPNVAANPVIRELTSQLLRHEASRDSLLTGAYRVAETDPQVERLRMLIEGTELKLLDAARTHLLSLDARVQSMDARIAQNNAQMRTLPQAEARERHLLQQVETLRRLREQLQEEYQRARMSEAAQAGIVQVIDLAYAARPVPPRHPLKIAVGLVFGLLIGGAGSMARERMSPRIYRKDQLEGVVGSEALAVIPVIEPPARHGSRKVTGRAAQKALRNSPVATLAAARPGTSPAAEAYRALRTNLTFARADLHTMLITSAEPGEGKSTTAANLATVFARQEKRVLLIDCDLRRPRLHALFGIPRGQGLTELVTGKVEEMGQVLHQPFENLFVMTAGEMPANPADLLDSIRMRGALEVARENFDLIILDTPPVLAAPDAPILSRKVDGVLLVTRAGRTPAAAAESAVEQIEAAGGILLGGVLNDPDGRVPRHGGGYFAYGYYRYDGA
jgi:capsular exopolysaccharide synthesis family protein